MNCLLPVEPEASYFYHAMIDWQKVRGNFFLTRDVHTTPRHEPHGAFTLSDTPGKRSETRLGGARNTPLYRVKGCMRHTTEPPWTDEDGAISNLTKPNRSHERKIPRIFCAVSTISSTKTTISYSLQPRGCRIKPSAFNAVSPTQQPGGGCKVKPNGPGVDRQIPRAFRAVSISTPPPR